MSQKNDRKNNSESHELSPKSLQLLGLSKQPFANEILSEKSFFQSQALNKISDNLTHQVQFSDLILLVEGNHGSGKTSLFRHFIQTEIANIKTLSMQAEATDTLTQIQQKMSIHLQDMGDASHLDDNLKNLQMFDQIPLIVMDNSHVLSDTTLQELFRYQQQLKQDNEVNLKFLFFANTGMQDTLQKIIDIQAEQMYVQNIPGFSPKQLDSFITHRLQCAGYSGEAILNDNNVQALFKKTDGTPLSIMSHVAPFIDKAIMKQQKPSSAAWLKPAALAFTLLLLAGGAYFAYNNFSPPEEETTQITATDLSPEVVSPVEAVEHDSLTTAEPAVAIESTEAEIINTPLTEPSVIEVTAAVEPVAETQEENKNTTALTAENILPAASEPIIESSEAEPIKQNIEISKAEVAIPVTKKVTAPELSPALAQLNKMNVNNAQWLSQQNARNWTMQLLGARDPETLLKFAQRNKLSSNAAWYKTWLSSKPYYVIVYGNYASRDLARAAIADLPQALRSLKPWVKSMASVQKAIK